jgi:hypothetical protein
VWPRALKDRERGLNLLDSAGGMFAPRWVAMRATTSRIACRSHPSAADKPSDAASWVR